MKVCISCDKEKKLDYYYFRKDRNKYFNKCKKCMNKNSKKYNKNNKENTKKYKEKYRKNNKDIINKKQKIYKENNKDKIKKYYNNNKDIINKKQKEYRENNKKELNKKQKEYREKNKKKLNKKQKEYREKNKDKIRKNKKIYYQNNKDLFNTYKMNRYYNDDEYKLICNIRSRLNNYLKTKNIQKNNSTIKSIGLTKELFTKWINFNLKLDNLQDKDYHLDHLQPLSSYNCKTYDEVINTKCNYWTNIIPISPENNLSKSDREPTKKELFKQDLRISIFKLKYIK